MSFVAGMALAVVSVIALWFLWSLFRRLWHSPQAVGQYWHFRKNRKGYESLSRGIIAAGAGDASAAAKHAAIAGNALMDEPLVNVLALNADERITAAIAVSDFSAHGFCVLATARGKNPTGAKDQVTGAACGNRLFASLF